MMGGIWTGLFTHSLGMQQAAWVPVSASVLLQSSRYQGIGLLGLGRSCLLLASCS